MGRIALLLFGLVFFVGVSHAQNRYNIDSLNQVIKTTSNDTVKINTLQWVFDNYLYSKPDSAKISYEQMLDLSGKKDFHWGFYNGYLYKATFQWTQSELDSVLVTMQKALHYAELLKDDTKISSCYTRIAMAHSHLGNYTEAKAITYKALNIAQKNNDWEGLYFAYYRLGNTFYYENDYDNALKNYLKVDSIFQDREQKEPALAASLANIGDIYMSLENYPKSEEYFLKSKDIYENLKREEGAMYAISNMGKLAYHKGDFQEAIEILDPVYNYYEGGKNTREMADILGWIAASQIALGEHEKALQNYQNSLEYSIDAKDPFLEANAHTGLGEIAHDSGNQGKAITHLKTALELYETMNVSYNKSQILRLLAESLRGQRDYEQALKYSLEYQNLQDSLVRQENAKNFQEMEARYQSDQKEKEIALLKSQNELVEQQKANQRNLLLGGIGITSIAGIFFFFLYRNRQKTTKKLQELDALKSNFFANISHEFRTPLTLISGPLQQKLEDQSLATSERGELEMMQRNSERLLNLVDQVLDLSKLESGSYKLQVSQGNLGLLIRAIAESFQFSAKQKEISYAIEVVSLENVWFDKDVIEKVTINLLSNAFKYTPNKGIVKILASPEKDHLKLRVGNTSDSLDDEDLGKLFGRFYQADNNADGVGIGLALVKELVERTHGTIEANKTGDNKLEFAVSLPVESRYFSKEELSESETQREEFSRQISKATGSAADKTPDTGALEDKELLLVVEDNADVREFIRRAFSNDFEVLEADNGIKGRDMAIETVPDIIISDIMMPKLNGLELCESLKTDERTSHIPIILLTAKAGEEDEYSGLETGADDYITKPFKVKLLETRIQNLVKSRKKLRDRYSQEVILKPKDIAITNLDEKFLERVQSTLDERLTESSFSVQEFSEVVGMSRMQLHRKLKALTGLSASEFIRSQRLKLAATLLQNSDASVSEIGYQVGFNDPSYFTKCFKEAYGCSPSEYSSK